MDGQTTYEVGSEEYVQYLNELLARGDLDEETRKWIEAYLKTMKG